MSQSTQPSSVLIFGAIRGIGPALIRQLAPLGYRLTFAARDQSRLDTLSGELHAEACSVEATDSDAVDRCLAKVAEKCARLDGLVNCMGSLFQKPAHATREEAWAKMLAVDSGLSALQARTQ